MTQILNQYSGTAADPADGAVPAAGGAAVVRYEQLAEHFQPVFARIAEGAVEREDTRTLPFEPVRWLTAAGFGALRVPAQHGGLGAGYLESIRLLIDLAEADSNVAHLFRSHFGFVESLAALPPGARNHWYARIAAGEIAGNAATERGGAALGTSETTLTEADGRWVVNGTKFYTTGSIFADWIQVTATAPGTEGRMHAIVAARQPGVEIWDDWDGFGQRLTGTGTAVFTDAVVAEHGVFARYDAAAVTPALFQLVLLAVLAGIGRSVLADTTAALQARTRNFNTGSGVLMRHEPSILQTVGVLAAKVHTAEQLVLAAARELDLAEAASAGGASTGGSPDAEAALRAQLAVDKAQLMVPGLVTEAAGTMFDTLGASALATGLHLDRHWRNARTVATHNPAVYKAVGVGDYLVNGTTPPGLTAIGAVSG